ncbi:MAG TPA: hypothetical protein VGF88_22280 [Acidobacteriaceae bacterium]|jgi:hypothetical protein
MCLDWNLHPLSEVVLVARDEEVSGEHRGGQNWRVLRWEDDAARQEGSGDIGHEVGLLEQKCHAS